MKKVLVFIALISSLAIGCANSATPENLNQANTNLQTAVNTETNQADVVAKTEETPLPIFTDANEALAEGDKLFDVSDNEKAIESYRQAVKLNPDLAEAYFKLGIAYSLFEKEQKDAGVPTEEEPTPTKKGKKDEPVLSDSDKAFENAAKAYEKILKKDAKNAAAHFNLGRSYNKLNKDKEAEKALRQAVKLNAEDSEYQTELGAILIKLAQYEEAVRVLKKAVELDAENSYALDLLEKAEAGKKRIDFANKDKPKTEKPQPQMEQPQPKEKPRPKETPQPKEEPSPKVGNSNK